MKNYSSKQFQGLTPTQLKSFILTHYTKNIQGQTIVNKENKVSIFFNSIGKRKTAKNYISILKAVAIFHLIDIMKNATYNNFGEAKAMHKQKFKAIGFLNYKYSCTVDGKKCHYRIPVMITANGKFQYDLHEHIK